MFPEYTVNIIETYSGKKLLIHNGYPYNKKHKSEGGGYLWCCTRRVCKAYLWISEDTKIVTANPIHDHPPSKYCRLHSGKYIKI